MDRYIVTDTVNTVCLAVVFSFLIFNLRSCVVDSERMVVEKAKICKEAGGFYQSSYGNCVKNPGVSQ